ncbi:hypothetical protein M378DRAFT_172501, partial [Amanita muscaria Koide BX008]
MFPGPNVAPTEFGGTVSYSTYVVSLYIRLRWCPPNPYQSIHCMRSVARIIRYNVAYLP